MSSVGYPTGKRPGTAYAAAQAAKARRQMIIVGALCVLLVGVLAFEAPSFLKLFGSSSSSSTSTTPVVTTPAPQTPSTEHALKVIRHEPASDPFSRRVALAADTSVRQVSTPPGSHDPFAVPPSSTPAPPASSSSASAPPATSTSLPEQIVIGTPGGNRTAQHGWIVILASIPTGEGEAAATQFAATARQNGIDQVSVLNSSNRRPLRGGYWVVFTGPFKSLGDVTARASQVHSHGYGTAYIRQLIVYG